MHLTLCFSNLDEADWTQICIQFSSLLVRYFTWSWQIKFIEKVLWANWHWPCNQRRKKLLCYVISTAYWSLLMCSLHLQFTLCILLIYLFATLLQAEVIIDGSVVRSGRNLTVIAQEFKLKETGKLIYTARATFYHTPVSKLWMWMECFSTWVASHSTSCLCHPT